jgi:putative aminopeptidase FrvX
MHSNYEVASTDDIEATAKIIAFTIKELKDGECLCF